MNGFDYEDTSWLDAYPVIDDSSYGGSSGDFQLDVEDTSWLDPYPVVDEPAFEPTDKVSRRARLRRNILSEEDDVGREELNFGDKALLGASRLGTEFKGGVVQGIGNIAEAAEGLSSLANPVTRKLITPLSRAARRKAEAYKEESRALDVDETDFDWASFLGGSLGSIVPTIGAGLLGTAVGGPGVGLAAAIGAGGAMSGGATFQAARERFKADGDNERIADLKALPIGIASGLITALITRGFGATGVEAVANGLTRTSMRGLTRNLAKQGGLEGLEEELDQYGQGFLEKLTFNPQKKIEDIATEAGLAFVGGALAGTTVTGFREAGGRILKGLEKPQRDQRTMEEALYPDPENQIILDEIQAPGLPPLESRSTRRANRPIVGTSLEQVMAELPPISRRGRRLGRGNIQIPQDFTVNVEPDQIIQERPVTRLRRQNAIIEGQEERVPEYPGTDAQLRPVRQDRQLPPGITEAGATPSSSGGIVSQSPKAPEVAPWQASIFFSAPSPDWGMTPESVAFWGATPEARATKYQSQVRSSLKSQIDSPTQSRKPVLEVSVPRTNGLSRVHGGFVDIAAKILAEDGLEVIGVDKKNGLVQVRNPQPATALPVQPGQVIEGGEPTNAEKETEETEGPVPITPVPAPVPGAAAPVTPVPPVQVPQTEQARLSRKRKGKAPVPPVIPAEPVDMTKAKKPPAPAKAKQQVHYEDAIQWIQDNVGKIKTKSNAGEGDRADYDNDDYRQVLKRRTTRILFAANGSAPNEIVQSMRDAGYVGDDFTSSDLWSMLLNAAKARQGEKAQAGILNKEQAKREAATEKFQSLALENKRNIVSKQKSKAQAIPVTELGFGDELEIDGHKFTVSGMHFDAETETLDFIQLSDGRKYGVQDVGGSQVIYPDPDTYKQKPVEFLPPEEDFVTDVDPADVQRRNELQAKTSLTMEEGNELQALESKLGQTFMPIQTETGSMPVIPEQEAAARKAQLASEANRPITAAPIQSQEDLFGGAQPENADIPLFSQPRPQQNRESIGPTIQLREGGPVITERSGIQNLRSMVETSALPMRTKQTIIAFLDQPLMKDLDWTGLQVDLTDFIDNGVTGQQLGRLITISTEAGADVFPHEVAHVMHYFLPKKERAELTRQREAAIKRKFGNNIPPGLLEGFGSSQFQTYGLPIEDYPLINDSEFFADFIGNRFAEQAFLDRNGKTLWDKLRTWVQGFVDALRRTVGLPPTREQMFRQMMAGVYKPNIQAIIDLEKQFSFSRDAKDAARIEQLTKNTSQQATEATHQLAQSVDFVVLMNKHGAGAMSTAAQNLVKLFDYLGIKAAGERLNNGVSETYRQLKARLGDFPRKWMSVIAAEKMAAFDNGLQENVRASNEATKRLQSLTFLKKLNEDVRRKRNLDTAEAVNRAAGPILESALNLVNKALKEEARNDTEIAELEAQLREISEAQKSSSAMSQLLADMVDVISYSGAGQAMLQNPNITRKELLDEYVSVKNQTSQPLHNPTLLKWASFILARNAELRDTLHAAQLGRNSNIRAGMGAYETLLMANLERDLVGTIMRERRLAKKLQSREDKARFAWWQLHKDLMKELNELLSQVEAGTLATNIMSDPDYRALRNEMYKDAGRIGSGEGLRQFRDKVLVMPDGTEVDISADTFRGTNVPVKMWATWEKARQDLYAWLQNNPDHDDFQMHMRSLLNLEEHYFNEVVLSPHDRSGIFQNAADTIQSAVQRAGGRLAASVMRTVAKLNFVKGESGQWRDDWSKRLTQQRLKTLESHGIKHNQNGGKESVNVANLKFHKEHLNELLYSLNRQAGGLKVGDRTKNGTIVTAEDMADAKMQSHMAELGYKIVEKNFGGKYFVVIDKRSGITFHRTPSKGTEYFVPRLFREDLKDFIKNFAKARTDKNEATQIDLLNSLWGDLFYPFVKDRNQDFAGSTPFDGPGNAFDLASQQHGSIRNFQEFIDFLVANSSATDAEAKAIVLTEWGNQINNLSTEESDVITPPVTGKTDNAFSKGRGNAVANFGFYKYGFASTSGDVSRFSGMIHSQVIDELLNGLNSLMLDVDARIAALDARALQVGRGQAVSERATERKNGDNYDHFNSLSSIKNNLQKAIDHISRPDPEEEGDVTFRRLTGGITGSLVQNLFTTLRNINGGKYLGMMMMRLNARSLFEHFPAFWEVSVVQKAKALGRGAEGIARGTALTLPAMARAVREAASSQAQGRRTRTFMARAFRDFLYETSEGIVNRWADIRDLKAQGLIRTMDLGKEWEMRWLAGIASSGLLMERDMTMRQQAMQGTIGAGEFMLMFFRGLFPTIGDYAQNAGIMRSMVRNKIGHKQSVQKALDKVYEAWQTSGYRNFNFVDIKDPVNRLSATELFPKGQYRVTSTQEDLEQASSWYQDSGLSLQEEAMKYLKARHDNTPNAEFLTGESETLFVNERLADLNKATYTHAPLALESKGWVQTLVRPLMGWRLRTLNTLNQVLSVSAKSEDARLMQYILMATVVALPMLLSFAVHRVLEEEELRKLSKLWLNQERSSKQPWEREGTKSQALGWTTAATYGIPFVDMATSALFDDLPTRASLEPTVVMLEKAKDVMKYVGGIWQTGDPTYGLARFIGGFVPDSKVILNRLESEQGKRLGSDVVALIRRQGPQDLLKPFQVSLGSGIRTELSPYGERMENAALNGDYTELKRVKDEAVQVAKEMGRPNPEKLVHQAYQGRNPFQRPLNTKMTEAQMKAFIAKLSPDEQAKVRMAEERYRRGADVIGANVYITKGESDSSGGFARATSLSRRRRTRRVGRIPRNRVGRISRRIRSRVRL